jgi:hypothetical protein
MDERRVSWRMKGADGGSDVPARGWEVYVSVTGTEWLERSGGTKQTLVQSKCWQAESNGVIAPACSGPSRFIKQYPCSTRGRGSSGSTHQWQRQQTPHKPQQWQHSQAPPACNACQETHMHVALPGTCAAPPGPSQTSPNGKPSHAVQSPPNATPQQTLQRQRYCSNAHATPPNESAADRGRGAFQR